jgi:anti-sigma B factor antagonist
VGGAETPPLLRVTVERAGDTAVIRLDGELDCSTAGELDAVMRRLLAERPPPRGFLVDAEGLSFVDVSGLAPLVRVGHTMSGHGTLQLRNAQRHVVRMIRLLGLADELGLDR